MNEAAPEARRIRRAVPPSMPAQTLRIGWVGFHREGLPALRGVLEAGVRLEGVVTLDAAARAKRSGGVSYAEALAGYGVPVHEVADINEDAPVRLLTAMRLDLLVVIGWSQILRAPALATASLGVVGAHASLLPHNRGSAPINWALIRGEDIAGNSLLWLTDGVDEGAVIDQASFPITPYDTCATLYDRVAETNRDMLLRLLPRLFAGETVGERQRPTDEPLLPRRRPADGLVDWTRPATQVYDFVRALTRPYPGAFSFLDGEKWILQACALLPDGLSSPAVPGTVVGASVSPVDAACGQVVACGRGAVLVLEVEDLRGSVLAGPALGDCPWTGKVWRNG